jgi:hypothetical protein
MNLPMKYYFKVWLFTFLVSPILVLGGLVYQKSRNFSDFITGLPIWFFAVFFGAVLALPALFLFRLLNKDFAKNNMPVYLKKSTIAIVGIALLWITFYFMNHEIFSQLSSEEIIWPLAYSLTLVVAVFIFKVKEDKFNIVNYS